MSERIDLVPGQNQGPEPGEINGGMIDRSVWPSDEEILKKAERAGRDAAQMVCRQPATWHAAFIAKERLYNEHQPVPRIEWHLLAMIESLMERTEIEFGGELPEPWRIDVTGEISMLWRNRSESVNLRQLPSGLMLLRPMQHPGDQFDIALTSPAQLAAALRELQKGEA